MNLMPPTAHHTIVGLAVTLALPTVAIGGGDEEAIGARPNGSEIARAVAGPEGSGITAESSLFRIVPPEPRTYQRHDLIQIIVRESSSASSTHELETKKDNSIGGEIKAWPHLDLVDILNLQLKAGNTPANELPAVDIALTKDFKGKGDYEREDDFTARLTAEVMEVMPNGNLVLEARTTIVNDDEISSIAVTGVCRPADVTAANTLLSSQIHDLRISKQNEGELKKTNEKGLVAQVFDFLFAW